MPQDHASGQCSQCCVAPPWPSHDPLTRGWQKTRQQLPPQYNTSDLHPCSAQSPFIDIWVCTQICPDHNPCFTPDPLSSAVHHTWVHCSFAWVATVGIVFHGNLHSSFLPPHSDLLSLSPRPSSLSMAATHTNLLHPAFRFPVASCFPLLLSPHRHRPEKCSQSLLDRKPVGERAVPYEGLLE